MPEDALDQEICEADIARSLECLAFDPEANDIGYFVEPQLRAMCRLDD